MSFLLMSNSIIKMALCLPVTGVVTLRLVKHTKKYAIFTHKFLPSWGPPQLVKVELRHAGLSTQLPVLASATFDADSRLIRGVARGERLTVIDEAWPTKYLTK
jgi:hypothetical protein